jgi:hypothetical protein
LNSSGYRFWYLLPSQELASPGLPPRPSQAHERHSAGHRRPAVPSAERGPDVGSADVKPEPKRTPRRLTRQPCTSSLAEATVVDPSPVHIPN